MKQIFLILSLVTLQASATLAQSGNGRKLPANQSGQDTIKLSTEEAILPINVTYLKDEQIPLRTQDLTAVEKGFNHQVTSVTRNPASIVLVIDNCVLNAAAKFKDVDLNLALGLEIIRGLPETDRISVITYADRVNVLAGWTSDRSDLAKQVNWKFKPGHRPLLYKALAAAADQLLTTAPDPRIVILISDGVGEGDPEEFEGARQALDRVRATVYVASQNALILKGVQSSGSCKVAGFRSILEPDLRKILAEQRLYAGDLVAADDRMQNLAESSGGGFWNTENRGDFADLRRQVMREIGSEYVISYSTEPGRKAGEFREITVLCTNPGVVVRVRKNVYVSPQQPGPPL